VFRTLPGFWVQIAKGQGVKVDLLNEDKVQDTFEPLVQILPLAINSIKDPEFRSNTHISPRVQVAFGLPLSSVQTSMYLRADPLKADVKVKGLDKVDDKCKASGQDGHNSATMMNQTTSVEVKLGAGIVAAIQIFNLVLDTNKLLGKTVSPSGGLYAMKKVFGHCYECHGYGCLQNLANAANAPINGAFDYIARAMSDTLTGVFEKLAKHSKDDALRKGSMLTTLPAPTKDEGM
jgi:hypothetical protein